MSTSPSRAGAFKDGALSRWRAGLFIATGLAVPLYAFPPFRVFDRDVDLATVLAALFVLSCAPQWIRGRVGRAPWILLALAVAVPALALLPPPPVRFSKGVFLVSGAHWLLVFVFFLSAATASWPRRSRRSMLFASCAAGVAVAAFALYQTFGIPRHWPGTGPFLLSIQREAFRFTRVGGTFFSGGYTRPTSVFLEPAWLGGYLAWIAASALGSLLFAPAAWSRRSRFFPALAASLATAAILASVSWGAYADFAVAIAALLVFSRIRSDRQRPFAALLLLVLALGVFFVSPVARPIRGAIAHRWAMLQRTSVSGEDPGQAEDSSWIRARNLRHTGELFVSRPWTGIGIGQFRLYAGLEVKGTPGLSMRDPWCGWAALAAELGIFGPLLLLAALVFAGRPAFTFRGPLAAVGIALVLLAAFEQIHTGSYLDLWWWYPLSLGAILARDPSQSPRVAGDS